MSVPTGEQLEIALGASRAVVTGVGAGLRAFEVNDVGYVETYPDSDKPPLGAGSVLIPWPNRTAGATWTNQDTTERLEVTEQARGNAIHGLVRRLPWTVVEHARSSVTLEVTVDGAPGYPFPFRTSIAYELGVPGLNVTHTVHNLGDSAMPFGVGTHPYLRPGALDVDDCELTLAATTMLPLGRDTMVPSGPPVPLRETEFDFSAGLLLRGIELDDAFGGCLPDRSGLIRHSVANPWGGVALWADPSFRWVQVFTPAEFPGRPGRAVAVEPMTCPPDALNSGIDLIRLEPGQSWTGRWGIAPIIR